MFMFSIQIQSMDSSFVANLSQIPKYFSVLTGSIEMFSGKLNSINFVNL